MEHPKRKDYAEMSDFNFNAPYAPYRDVPRRTRSNNSHDGLVNNDYGVSHARSASRDSRHSRSSIEGRHPTQPGFGMAY
jgi:hypothetical protein